MSNLLDTHRKCDLKPLRHAVGELSPRRRDGSVRFAAGPRQPRTGRQSASFAVGLVIAGMLISCASSLPDFDPVQGAAAVMGVEGVIEFREDVEPIDDARSESHVLTNAYAVRFALQHGPRRQEAIAVTKVADWRPGHCVPESVCTCCNAEFVDSFEIKGDWCTKHELPDSKCFACHPELEAKFLAIKPKEPR